MTVTDRLGVAYAGPFAERPESAEEGDTYYATDTFQLFVWGDGWHPIGGGVGGTANVDFCHVKRTNTQAIVSGTETPMIWEAEVVDTNDMWAAGDPTHIVIRTAGIYHVIGHAVWAARGSTDPRYWLLKFEHGETPDVTMFSAQMFANVDMATDRDLASVVSGYINLQVGDKVRMDVRHFSGSNLNIQGEVAAPPNYYWRPWLQVMWVRDVP